MARKKFSCDFETTTIAEDCRVWAYGYMEIGKFDNYKIGNNLDDFMEWVAKIKGDLYFHNLRFDGSFIINWLLRNGFKWNSSGLKNTFSTTISAKMNAWYSIDICYGYKGKRKLHTNIYDSLKKLPFTVAQIGYAFKLDVLKGEIDYHAERPKGHEITEEEYKYIKNDIEIIAKALDIQFKQGLDSMTIGRDSMNNFKDSISLKAYDKLFPQISLEMDAEIRMAYRGGFTWLNEKYAEKDVGEGLVFDVNSLYPYVMYDRLLPYGLPVPYLGEYVEDSEYPLFIQHIRCEFALKDERIPTIQIKRNPLFRGNEYLKTSKGEIVDLYLSSVDLEIIKEHYDLYDIEYLEGWKFRGKSGFFKKFIDYWSQIKATNTGALRQLAKLMLNNLYGKFASNPNITGKIPFLNETGVLSFFTGEEDYTKPVYTAMGIFITSWARDMTIRTAQACYDRIIYCDTDSLHLTGLDIPDVLEGKVHKTKLGCWDMESVFKRGRFLRQKTYCEEVYTDDERVETEFKVTCAGMSQNIKDKVTWDNFHIGFTSFGNLKSKQVPGGVVLLDTEFTIK